MGKKQDSKPADAKKNANDDASNTSAQKPDAGAAGPETDPSTPAGGSATSANTTDEAKQPAAGAPGPEKDPESPANQAASKSETQTKSDDQVNAGAGDTDNSNKGAGGGSGDEELEIYVCVSPIKYAPPGQRPHLFGVGDPIELPIAVARPLLILGRIAE